jgi:hypothetical protein
MRLNAGSEGCPVHNELVRAASLSRRRYLAMSAAALIMACGPATTRPGDALVPVYANPAKNEWPAEFLQLPAETQAMYRYAVANEEVLKWFPCYCGCVDGGHRSNFDCYVREVHPNGRVRLDTMSFG